MRQLVALSVPATLAEVTVVTGELRTRVQSILADEHLDRFEIAAAEALTNIVRHAYAGAEGGEIVIELLERETGSVELVLHDRGQPAPAGTFERKALPSLDADDPDTLPEHGWGIGLLHQCADNICFTTDPDGNELRLSFSR